MRLPIIAGNWKMNTTVAEGVALVQAMRDELAQIDGVERVLCPPFPHLVPVAEQIAGTPIQLGAQNMHWVEKGAYTGEVSASMLLPICRYVILGHSERRQYFGETDQTVNLRVKAALAAGLVPIVCVGERLEEREGGKTEEVITRQVRGAFEGIGALGGTVVAYEPVWAIGTGRAATGPMANQTIELIRLELGELYGTDVADDVRIQYGGSVTAANVAEFIREPDIDGALVGGASLKAAEFISIVRQTAESKAFR